jgi:hypothetical protein
MHGILRLLPGAVLDLLGLARLLELGGRTGGGADSGPGEAAACQAGGAGE